MRDIGLVTSNPHKLEEFQHGLGPLGVKVHHLDVDCDEVQAATLEEVVDFCLDQVRSMGHRDFILDDSGLFINSLKGFPGVYSSYVFETIGCSGIIRLLEDHDERGAEFRCCIGGDLEGIGRLVVTGISAGRIIDEERGGQGFGYDPIFIPEGSQRTFAQMDLDEKSGLSHRGAAMRSFVTELGSRLRKV